MSTSRQYFRSRPSSLNLDSKMPTPPSRSISFHGSGIGSGCSISSASQYWYQQQRRSQNGLRRQASFCRRVQSSTSPRGVLMTKLLNDGMHWNGTIYRNNANRWRDSWTLLDNPILMLNTDEKGGSGVEADDEGFYGSCCLGDYTDMNDNDLITSFSNPNYGLDAVNSNSLTSPNLLSNSSATAGRRYDVRRIDVIDNRGHSGGNEELLTQIDNIRHFTSEYDQVDVSSVSGCSSDSDEDSAVDIPTPPPTDHRPSDRITPSYGTITGPVTPSVRQPLQAPCVCVLGADSQPLNPDPTSTTSNCNAISLLECDVGSRQLPSSTLTTSSGGSSKETSSSFRDVYSPDSNDSGISTGDRSRVCRRRSRGHGTTGRCDVSTGSELTPEIAELRKIGSESSTEWDQASSVSNIPSESSSEILPSGWEKHADEDGAYYWHIKSGTIQREPPVLLSNNASEKSPSLIDGEVERTSSYKEPRSGDVEPSAVRYRHLEQQYSSSSSGSHSLDVDCPVSDDPYNWCQHCPQLEGIEYEGLPIRFAVHSLGWVQMSDEDLTPERSSKAVNRCIVGLSVGKNDINDVVGRWGDGKSLYLELDEENVTLLDPQDLSILNVQPIQSIRIWGVGRNNGRDFAYVARDCATRKHMCHVFRCDGLARHIANALRDICKRILAERSAVHRSGRETDAEAEMGPGDSPPGTAGCASSTTGGAACRPTNLPNLTRRGTAQSDGREHDPVNGEHLTFESIYKNTSFPTPMEEPRKIVRCHYLGTTQVLRPTGVDVLNKAMDNVYTRALPEKWVYVNVAVAPSTITITEHGKADNVFAECRVRFLSFMGIAMNNVRLCAFIVHCAQDQFIAHVFHCDPSASTLCKTIEAACKLRYQKCLDAGQARSAVSSAFGYRRQAAVSAGSRDSKGLRVSLRQGVQSMIGNLTKGCKP